jgi:hypothetical protein
VSYNTERTLSASLIEHWNGAQWSLVPSPNPSTTLEHSLRRRGGRARNDVWAVGSPLPPASGVVIHALERHRLDGGSEPAGRHYFMSNLMALTVISANDIWAVGSGPHRR